MNTVMKRLQLCLLSLYALLSAAEFRLEADLFSQQKGNWQIGKAIQNTGNQYLVAMEKGCELQEDFIAPAAGIYTIWAYTLTMQQGWRKCTLGINGCEIGSFGDSKQANNGKNGFYWEKLPQTVTLPAGKFHVTITSHPGMGRIDCLLFTTDADFDPSQANKAVWEKIPVLQGCMPPPPESLLPAVAGKGPAILLIHGSRPWTAGDTQTFLLKAGASVLTLNSEYLDGLGGASIKRFLTDKEEPKAKDGITPAFQILDRFKLVVITAIPENCQEKIFTPERVALLKKYLENGGALLVGYRSPKALAELLPVRFTGPITRPAEELVVHRGNRPAYAVLPESWPHIGKFRNVELTDGAAIVMPLMNADGKTAGIFAAEKTIGKGKVIFYNSEWVREQGMRQLYSWAYGRAMVAALAADTANIPLHPEKTVYAVPEPPAHKQHDALRIRVAQPEMLLQEINGKAKIEGKTFRLANGIQGTIKENGKLDFTWPDADVPYIRDMEPPVVSLSSALADVDSRTSELKEGEKIGEVTLAGNWKFQNAKATADGVTLRYSNGDTLLSWTFSAGILHVDGVTYQAFADKPTITSCPHFIQSFKVQSHLALGKDTASHRVRRLSCYSPPRGFAEYDFSGKDNADTNYWSFFGSGQPFTWVTAATGIYSEFVNEPIPSSARLSICKGDSGLQQTLQRQCGYRKAPVSVPKTWHAFTSHRENSNNEWMAMYQFQRKYLRDQLGLPSLPPLPTITWQNVCSNDEKEAAVKVASELGFRRAHIPLCPSPIISLASTELHNTFGMIAKYGLLPFAWSAGDYSHGDNEAIFLQHPEWYLRNQQGEIHHYGGKTGHPVLDLNNADFQKWYFEVLDSAIRGGLKAIYFDMYGTAIGNINYAKKDSPSCLEGGIKIFRYLLNRGISIGVEGQNPLVQDNWWYRQEKYTAPFQGKEFSILCASPSSGNTGDDLALDYFRTSMFCTFLYVNTDGYPRRFERTPGENERIARMGRLNPMINRAIDTVGYPFIRETPFGTSWISPNGGALFFYDGAKEITVDLPKGWSIEGVSGNVLKNIVPESIFILRKK